MPFAVALHEKMITRKSEDLTRQRGVEQGAPFFAVSGGGPFKTAAISLSRRF
jgi:hypothetical protein